MYQLQKMAPMHFASKLKTPATDVTPLSAATLPSTVFQPATGRAAIHTPLAGTPAKATVSVTQ